MCATGARDANPNCLAMPARRVPRHGRRQRPSAGRSQTFRGRRNSRGGGPRRLLLGMRSAATRQPPRHGSGAEIGGLAARRRIPFTARVLPRGEKKGSPMMAARCPWSIRHCFGTQYRYRYREAPTFCRLPPGGLHEALAYFTFPAFRTFVASRGARARNHRRCENYV